MSSRSGARGTSLTIRLLTVGSLVALGLILAVFLMTDGSLRAIWLDALDDDLESMARLAATSVPTEPESRADWATATAEAGSVRVTLIDDTGLVLADSAEDPATMESQLSRPEVAAALGGEVGKASRVSTTTGIDQRYLVLPPRDGVMVRVSTAATLVDDQLARTRGALARGALVACLVVLAGLALWGRRLAGLIGDLAERTRRIGAGEVDDLPDRSAIRELDRLSVAVSTMAGDLGRRVAEAERESAMLEVVLGAIPQGTVLFEGDVVAFANQAATTILGTTPSTLAGLAPLAFQTAIREARVSGAAVVAEADHGRPARRLRGVATAFTDDDRVLLALSDITERERTDAIRRDFAANASHELKTPVATIIAASEALQISLAKGDGTAEGFVARIAGSARQLDRLIADLLDLSRLELETPQMALLRLDHLVAAEIDRIRDRAADNELTIEAVFEEVAVMASRRDLAVAIHNLLDNAIRYTPPGGRIDVAVGAVADEAQVTVADSGAGIPTRDLERVFERFYRVDSARSRDTGGTGLGLAIVRHVAESHGGRAWVESELGRGSRFTIRIPLRHGEGPGRH
jgi:two-component system, OmpR family, phosphate regulon sensor histidine kinase PhoR